jgi:hypothetical protein
MYASQLFLLDARRIRRKARRVYACCSAHVKRPAQPAVPRLAMASCSSTEASNTRSIPSSPQVRGLFPPARKLTSNLWILWKTQDSRLWNLWITSLEPLFVHSPLAIIGSARRTAQIHSRGLDICHSAPNTCRLSPLRAFEFILASLAGPCDPVVARRFVSTFHKAFRQNSGFHSPVEGSHSKRRPGAAIFHLMASPRKVTFPRCGKFCG